jgi:hypothetical protein
MTVIFLAIMTAVIWYLSEPIIFTMDSYAYLNSAKAIAGIDNGSLVYFRAPFLPLLLAITKVPTLQTFSWFILAQIILGISCIIIMHDCLRRISRPIGLIATLLFISTFMGLVHSKSIMTEEIYLFGWCLCINGVFSYLSKPAKLSLLQITIALLILVMTRAQGAFVAFVVLPFLVCCLPKRMPEIIVSAVALCLITLGYSHVVASKTHLMYDQKNAATSKFGVTNTTGKMLFMVVYSDPYKRMKWSLVHPENGPASLLLFTELKQYYSIPANLPAKADDTLFGQFAGNPQGLIAAMENKPNEQYWWAIWGTMDKYLGAGAADNLLMRVTIETILTHPFKVATIYARNFVVDLVRADSSYVWAHPRISPESIGPLFSAELEKSGDYTRHTHLAKLLDFYFPAAQIILLILAIICFKRLWYSPWCKMAIFCLVLLIYNNSTVAMAATPESRYTFYIFPLLLVMVTMGLTLKIREYKAN